MPRRTKIIATIGPASDSEQVLSDMVAAGMDVARLGLAHGTLDEALDRYHRIRQVAKDHDRRVGILVDLPGPKVRVASFPDGGVAFEAGHEVNIRPGYGGSTVTDVEIEYDNILQDIQVGDMVGFGDGQVGLEILDIDGSRALGQIVNAGFLVGRPGFRVPSDRLSMPTPTERDLKLLDAFVEHGVDMVAVSFVRSAHDVRRVGTEPHPRGPLIIAKIETRAAVDNLEAIIDSSGAIMVARGDLGSECDLSELPHLQKAIIRDCIAGGLPVITATQMLDSMVNNIEPTRAEASDVANAVFDGTSAVMLSAETAIGSHPVRVIETMARIAERADEKFDYVGWASTVAGVRHDRETNPNQAVTDAMTLAGWRVTAELGINTVVCISGTGFTVRSMARFRPEAQILGFSSNDRTVQQLTMSWGVTPILADTNGAYEARVNGAIAQAKREGHVRSGEMVAVIAGVDGGMSTDVLRVVRVP